MSKPTKAQRSILERMAVGERAVYRPDFHLITLGTVDVNRQTWGTLVRRGLVKHDGYRWYEGVPAGSYYAITEAGRAALDGSR